MIDCPERTGLPRNRINRDLEIAGCRVALAIDAAEQGGGASAAAARLAEDLVTARVGCERGAVRIAALMPSGRPVATIRGRAAAISVSLSHIGPLVGAAACAAAGVGLDIVDPAGAGQALDVWFTPDELAMLPDDDGLLRARLWGAKESAYKAARLDDGFRPRSVEIDGLGRTRFRWSVRGDHGSSSGQGVFTLTGMHLVAIAVAAKILLRDTPVDQGRQPSVPGVSAVPSMGRIFQPRTASRTTAYPLEKFLP